MCVCVRFTGIRLVDDEGIEEDVSRRSQSTDAQRVRDLRTIEVDRGRGGRWGREERESFIDDELIDG